MALALRILKSHSSGNRVWLFLPFSAWLELQESCSGCPINQGNLGCVPSTHFPAGTDASKQLPDLAWAGTLEELPPEIIETI